MSDAERHRDEALAMVEKLAIDWHHSIHDRRPYQSCSSTICREAAQFLIRVRSEILRESDYPMHDDLDTCIERAKEASRE